MNARDAQLDETGGDHGAIAVPAPTAAPLVLSLGATLLAAGCVTNWALSGLGALLTVWGLGGWIRQLLPGRGEVHLPRVAPAARPSLPTPSGVAIDTRRPAIMRRLQVPEQIHPYSSGIWGGLIGGAAMAIVALAYGVVSGRGIWYPVNLLAAMLMPALSTATETELQQFNGTAVALGAMIHVVASAATGLIYGVLLPTLPRWPVLWGGLVAPLLWTGAIYGSMGVLNPTMNARVDWPWFVASQVVFGLTCGIVAVSSKKVPSSRRGPRAERGSER